MPKPKQKSVLKSGKSKGMSSSSTTRFGLHGKFAFTMTAGSIIDQIDPVLLGAPLSTIAEEFLFYKFHRLKFRVIRLDLDATLAETPKMCALGVFQASNAIGVPLITTSENNVKNVQYFRASHIAPEVAPTFTGWYEWLEPDLAIGPIGGWFRTVSGSDDEDGDSSGILYFVADVTTGNTTVAQIEYEVDVEFKEIVEDTITPNAGSLALRYPGFRSLPGSRKPRFIDFKDPSQHPIMNRIRWPLRAVVPLGNHKNIQSPEWRFAEDDSSSSVFTLVRSKPEVKSEVAAATKDDTKAKRMFNPKKS
jgi:hypothetical protein